MIDAAAGWAGALQRALDRAAAWQLPPDGPAALRERLDALERIEVLLLGESAATDIDAAALRVRAAAAQSRLAVLNESLYQRLREAIRHGEGRDALLDWAAGFADDDGAHGDGYGSLDELIAGVLPFEPAADVAVEQPADMVFYQPTPARHIFDLIRRAAPDERDVLVDLGAGLGHVPMLFSICTGARGIGIEREAAYVECARRTARALGLPRVSFVEQDARQADFSQGNLFYLYTPFGGAILRSVLDALRDEASRRAIRLASYGPCTQAVLEEPWLAVVGACDPGRIVLFRSRPCDGP